MVRPLFICSSLITSISLERYLNSIRKSWLLWQAWPARNIAPHPGETHMGVTQRPAPAILVPQQPAPGRGGGPQILRRPGWLTSFVLHHKAYLWIRIKTCNNLPCLVIAALLRSSKFPSQSLSADAGALDKAWAVGFGFLSLRKSVAVGLRHRGDSTGWGFYFELESELGRSCLVKAESSNLVRTHFFCLLVSSSFCFVYDSIGWASYKYINKIKVPSWVYFDLIDIFRRKKKKKKTNTLVTHPRSKSWT